MATPEPVATVEPVEPVAPVVPAAAEPAEPVEPFDQERAMALIVKLREEVKAEKAKGREAGDLKKRLDEIEAAQLTEQEKLEKRAEDAEARLTAAQARVKTANLVSELAKPEHGIVNAQAAAKLIDGVEFDDDGQPSNLDALLPAFLEANAFLRGAQQPPPAPNVNPGAGGSPGAPPPLNAAELQAAEAMGLTAEEYAAYKPQDGELMLTIDDYRRIEKSAAAANTP